MTHAPSRLASAGSHTMIATLICLLLCACSSEQEEPSSALSTAPDVEPLTILALGDSLTEGLGVAREMTYPSQLERQLEADGHGPVRVINAGVSGETSSGLLQRLDWVLSQDPDVVILTIGANDAMRALPLDLLETNLEAIIERILATEATLILGGMQMYDNLGAQYTGEFRALYARLARDYRLPLIPFFLDGVAGVETLNNPDLIHPNADGYRLIVEKNILPVLEPVLKQLAESPVSAQPSTRKG